jgi:hypothetical protein
MTPLAGWQTFYAIVGSSAGALIGLQFVVMALITSSPNARIDPQAGSAFGTPTIVHFSVALLLSAAITAPWRGAAPIAVILVAIGLAGVLYESIVTHRLRRQTAYRPEFEDWLFHSILPLAAYATLAAAGFTAHAYLRESLFAVAAASLLLLFIGIHNAWDAVTYHLYVVRRRDE